MVNVDSIKVISDTKCHAVIFLQEKSQTSNEIKRILATELANFLNQPMTKTQLTNLGVEEVIPMIAPDEDQLKEYLDKPPKGKNVIEKKMHRSFLKEKFILFIGIDPRMWKQAIHDNPDPKKFIPVPIVGFDELKWRIKCQERETETHAMYLAKVQRDLAELKQKHADATANILGHKRKLADLSHRILTVNFISILNLSINIP